METVGLHWLFSVLLPRVLGIGIGFGGQPECVPPIIFFDKSMPVVLGPILLLYIGEVVNDHVSSIALLVLHLADCSDGKLSRL